MNRLKGPFTISGADKTEFAKSIKGLINKILLSFHQIISIQLKSLRFLPEICCCLAVIYGYWGAFTKSGSKLYEEMDGMIPFFILVISLFILFILLSVRLYKFFFKKK